MPRFPSYASDPEDDAASSGPPPAPDAPDAPKAKIGIAVTKSPGAGAGKMSQSEAVYRGPEDRCEECTNWQEPNACKLVDGNIDPDGWCKLYEASTSEAAGPEEDMEGEQEPAVPAGQKGRLLFGGGGGGFGGGNG